MSINLKDNCSKFCGISILKTSTVPFGVDSMIALPPVAKIVILAFYYVVLSYDSTR